MKRVWSKLAAVGAGVCVMTTAALASASNGLDSPGEGVEMMGRGNAWVARADSPLAAFYNPAALAWQATGVHLGAQLLFSDKCYTRTTIDPATGKQVAVPADQGVLPPLLPGEPQPADGSKLPSGSLCAKHTLIPNPQIAATFRITNQLAIGLAVVAPHSTGKAEWGESLAYSRNFNGTRVDLTQPSPQRYMLVSADALIINPTVSVAFAPTEYLSFGAGFIWGIATAHFVNFSESVSPKPMAGDYGDHSRNDVRSELKTKDLFMPGFILSAMWSATPNLDVAAWFKWQDALKGTGDLHLESLYWKSSGQRELTACEDRGLKKGCNITDAAGAGSVRLNMPMEAKLGVRYHLLRKDQPLKPGWAAENPEKPGRRVRDPLSEDWFDFELDFTWANNSAVQNMELTFKPGIAINDGTMAGVGQVPKNGNIPRNWRDVFGIRAGGDFVVIPNRLSLRTGGFFETKGQDDQYLAVDFNLGWKAGVGGGGTVRVGPVDISIGYQHTFFGTLDNGGKGQVYALSGDASGSVASGGEPAVCDKYKNAGGVGQGCFRSWQAVNGGKLTQSMNEFGFAASARF